MDAGRSVVPRFTDVRVVFTRAHAKAVGMATFHLQTRPVVLSHRPGSFSPPSAQTPARRSPSFAPRAFLRAARWGPP
jgi:hypothetical protein